jgi:hypothetical protein
VSTRQKFKNVGTATILSRLAEGTSSVKSNKFDRFNVGYILNLFNTVKRKTLPMKMVLQPGGLSLRVGVGAFGVGGYSTLFMYTAIKTGIEISVF